MIIMLLGERGVRHDTPSLHPRENREAAYGSLSPQQHDYHFHIVSGCDSCPTISRLGLRCPIRVPDFFSTLGFASIVLGMVSAKLFWSILEPDGCVEVISLSFVTVVFFRVCFFLPGGKLGVSLGVVVAQSSPGGILEEADFAFSGGVGYDWFFRLAFSFRWWCRVR